MFSAMRALAAGEGRAFEDLEASRRWLVDRDHCTGRVGVVGFCMGEGFALLPASTGDHRASAVDYGAIPDDALDLFAGARPIVASYGAGDRSLRGAAERLEAVLGACGVDHDIMVYPDAGHGFLNDHAPGRLRCGPGRGPVRGHRSPRCVGGRCPRAHRELLRRPPPASRAVASRRRGAPCRTPRRPSG